MPDLDRVRFPPGSWYIGFVIARVIAKSSSSSSRMPVAEMDRIRWVWVVRRQGLELLESMEGGWTDEGWTDVVTVAPRTGGSASSLDGGGGG